jgi:hypothetical protein
VCKIRAGHASENPGRPNATDGIWTFDKNVIINSDSGSSPLTHFIVVPSYFGPDWSRFADTDNLKGVAADNIVDGNGLLQGSYRTTYLYLRGHEVPS